MAAPTADEIEDALLSCRYGEFEEVQAFVASFGIEPLSDARDNNGNSCLHFCAANGHIDILRYLLPLVPVSLLSAANASDSTALSWASLNGHLDVVQGLVLHSPGPGDALIDIKNAAGRTPVGDAEMMDHEEVASWLVSRMLLGDDLVTNKAKGESSTMEGDMGEEEEGEQEEETELFRLSLNDKDEVVVKDATAKP